MDVLPALLGATVIALGVAALIWYFDAKKKFEALPHRVQLAITEAKEARSLYRQTSKRYEAAVRKATEELELIRGPRGRRLIKEAGIVVWERWIDTPQGGGPIFGVRASAADESNIRQRFTATRMLAFGVFALAAPKSKTGGHAYVVIEGPTVSGVATLSAESNAKAGPAAYDLAARINNLARKAEEAEGSRPQKIEVAKKTLEQAKDQRHLKSAAARYSAAVAALPTEHALRFKDAPKALALQPSPPIEMAVAPVAEPPSPLAAQPDPKSSDEPDSIAPNSAPAEAHGSPPQPETPLADSQSGAALPVTEGLSQNLAALEQMRIAGVLTVAQYNTAKAVLEERAKQHGAVEA